ncbi:MAG: FHA domain-containing protein [Candidatus Cloacimonadaceae bacterium]|nr:FHA domain-containing protein [Candidatus Cloacimonadaceae bacterium]
MKRILIMTVALGIVLGLSATQVKARYIKTDTGNYPFLISSVQVLDSSDEPMKDLTEKRFKVFIDAKASDSLKTTTYEKTGQGLHIILCIDASGTMKGSPMESIQAAVIPFIDKIRSVDKVAIAIYADDYQLLTDFTGEKELLKKTVRDIKPAGRYTSLYYGGYKALQRLVANEEMTGKIMVLTGDGKDENPTGSYRENDLINLAQTNGIPVFTIGYTQVEQIYLQSLERIAENTGGSYYYAPHQEDLSKHFDKLYRQIMHINLLSYFVVGIAGDGAEHNLGIEVTTDMGKRDLSAKFIAPAGRPAYARSTGQKTKPKINPVMLAVIIALIALIAATLILINKRVRKKKQAVADDIRRLEEQKNSEIEAERKKIAALEQEIHRAEEPAASLPIHPIEQKPPDPKILGRERTMILSGGQTVVGPKTGAERLRMEILFGNEAGKVFTIDKSGTTLGRAADNGIVLADKTVSSHHASITYVEGYFVLEDIGSTNGVFINGNKTQIYRLENDCSFKLGSVEGNFTLL